MDNGIVVELLSRRRAVGGLFLRFCDMDRVIFCAVFESGIVIYLASRKIVKRSFNRIYRYATCIFRLRE